MGHKHKCIWIKKLFFENSNKKKYSKLKFRDCCAKLYLDLYSLLKKIEFMKFSIPKFLFYMIMKCTTISQNFLAVLGFASKCLEMIISISRSGLLKSCARFIIERSEIRKKQHDFKSVHFEYRMVLFYMTWKKSRLLFHRM